jgi:hypothetical protein
MKIWLSTWLLGLIFAVTADATATAATTPGVQLHILAGQSNAQGWRGDAAAYPADPEGLDARIPFFYFSPNIGSSDGKWVTLGAQKGLFPQGHFGPEVGFARALKKRGGEIALFKYTRGSTGLDKNWKAPGAKGLYDDMVVKLREAIALLEKGGQKVTIASFTWIQGESDADTPEHADAYRGHLEKLIGDFRGNVAHNSALPFILGMDEQHAWVKQRPQVVEAQKAIAAADPHVAFTSMMGLEKADGSHLKPQSLPQHGLRLFEAWQSLQKR